MQKLGGDERIVLFPILYYCLCLCLGVRRHTIRRTFCHQSVMDKERGKRCNLQLKTNEEEEEVEQIHWRKGGEVGCKSNDDPIERRWCEREDRAKKQRQKESMKVRTQVVMQEGKWAPWKGSQTKKHKGRTSPDERRRERASGRARDT